MYYFNWDTGEPNTESKDEDFIHMRKNGGWNDEEDTKGKFFGKKQFGVVCQNIDLGETMGLFSKPAVFFRLGQVASVTMGH